MSLQVSHSTNFATEDLPQVFGRYLLLRRLSRGGMGEIFIGKSGIAGFEKLCVIKKVLPHLAEDKDFIRRFIDEAQVAIKLQHANIAQVFEVGRVGEEYFLALEYVEGRDLRKIQRSLAARDHRLEPDQALFIAREIAGGLAYAHRSKDAEGVLLNLVHCDISPPNVVISYEGEVKLIDFGIAKSAIRQAMTDPKLGFGKFGYMAPEQLVRGGKIDYRTDIYAAGVVLYEMLVGERMFEPGQSPDYRALARMVARGNHPLPSHIDPTLKPFDQLVAKALKPKADDRYQSAGEFRDSIQHMLVQVNPTMHQDHLGSFMRGLFADEQMAERELLTRVKTTDLSPFADELSTAGAGTITFALGDLPLPPPPPGADTDVQVPLGGGIEPPGNTLDVVHSPRKRWGLVAAVAVAALLLAGISFALSGSPEPEPEGPTTPRAEAPTPVRAGAPGGLRVERLEVPEDDDPEPEPPVVEPEPEPEPPVAEPEPKAKKPERKARRKAKRNRRPGRKKKVVPKAKVAPKEPVITEADVQRKFRALSREYSGFRRRYGERLAKEWADLAASVQHVRGDDRVRRLDSKIDAFRRKLRSVAN